MTNRLAIFSWLLCLWIGSVFPGGATDVQAQQRPNLILINLDDADSELFELAYSPALFPNIMQLADDGMRFTNMHVTTPFCGPSRASLYRAQYAHRTGICVNRPEDRYSNGFGGGFRAYREQGFFEDDLSIWMKNAGYRTMMVGKFLHADVEPFVPPGWDDFYYYLGGRYFGCFRFTNERSANGNYDQLPETVYRTNSEADQAVALIRRQLDRDPAQPFFLNINPLGPHRGQASHPEMIETRMANWWPSIVPPYSPAFNEVDISDKGGLFAQLNPLDEQDQLSIRGSYRQRALATRSVDDLVGQVRRAVQDLGIAENTYIMVTSDNGFVLGHQRYLGKGVPLDRASRVPFLVIGPGVPAGQSADHLLAHLDIGPTLVRLAGGKVPGFVDGRSFAELLKPGGATRIEHFRLGVLIENWSSHTVFGLRSAVAASNAIRFEDSLYVDWANGDREFYDLLEDPDQLENIYDELELGEQLLADAWLRALKNPELPTRARYTTPYEFNEQVSPEVPLEGLAEDAVGVAQVRLAIRDIFSKQYWNGQHWQDEFVQVAADLSNPGGQISQWTYGNLPPRDSETSGNLVAWAWAYDREGRFDPPQVALFHYARDSSGN